jgi:hypothetical protein
MSQNLPIQGPQVMEIQGGVRLTPLGLQQLGAEANRFLIKTQLPTDKILFNTYASAVIQKGGTISAVVRGGGNNKTLGVLTLHGFATA